MHLYNAQGAGLHLADDSWCAILDLAREHGWKPAGTLGPPLDFDLTAEEASQHPWTGSYAPSTGQMVTPRDARALAEALSEVLAGASWAGIVDSAVPADLLRFCKTGGFLLCSAPAVVNAPSMLELDAYVFDPAPEAAEIDSTAWTGESRPESDCPLVSEHVHASQLRD